MWPIALPMFPPCSTPGTSDSNPTEMQISYVWTTYVSSSDLCIAHIRAAWPITAHWIKLWMWYQGVLEPQTTRTVSIYQALMSLPEKLPMSLFTVMPGCMQAHGRIYGDKLQKEIKKYSFSFCFRLMGEPMCSSDSRDGGKYANYLQIIPQYCPFRRLQN